MGCKGFGNLERIRVDLPAARIMAALGSAGTTGVNITGSGCVVGVVDTPDCSVIRLSSVPQNRTRRRFRSRRRRSLIISGLRVRVKQYSRHHFGAWTAHVEDVRQAADPDPSVCRYESQVRCTRSHAPHTETVAGRDCGQKEATLSGSGWSVRAIHGSRQAIVGTTSCPRYW